MTLFSVEHVPNEAKGSGIGKAAVVVADMGDLGGKVELLEELRRHGYTSRGPVQALLLVVDGAGSTIVLGGDGLGSGHCGWICRWTQNGGRRGGGGGEIKRDGVV